MAQSMYPSGHGHVTQVGPESSVHISYKHCWEKQSFHYKLVGCKPEASGVHSTFLGERPPERSREIQNP